MMQERFFTDEDLRAYLDYLTDFSPIDEINSALATDMDLARRVESMRLDTNVIASSFSSLLQQAPAAPEITSKNKFSRWSLVASGMAACVGLFIGYSVNQTTLTTGDMTWMDNAAIYQALYINSTLNHLKPTRESQLIELQRVASAIGKEIDLDALHGSSEVDYNRAQILGFEGIALIQLAFLTSTGEPMALCILRSQAADSSKINENRMAGLQAASWAKDGYEYLLIGGQDASLVSRLAANFSMANI